MQLVFSRLKRSFAALAIGLLALSGLVSIEAVTVPAANATVMNLDAPVVTAVNAPAPNQLTVSFTAPTNPAGLSITAYRIETSTDGATWTPRTSSFAPAAGTMSYDITGLTPNTKYFVRVAAYAGGYGSWGYKWEKIYSTQNPSRDTNKQIVYDTGFGLGNNDAAVTYANATYSRIRYRMGATYDGANNYVDADFSKNMSTVGASSETYTAASDLRYLRIPTADDGVAANQFEIQGDVTDLTVLSNVNGVANGSGFTGRVEIWPWNYATEPNTNISSRAASTYDDGDTWNTNGQYGSFQLHRLDSVVASNNKTLFAWNHHFNGLSPEIGFGDNTGTHSDWTFCSNGQWGGYTCQNRTNFSLAVYINPAVATQNSVAISYNLNGGSGTTPTTTSVAPNTATTLATNSGFSKPGYNFAGWSDGTTTSGSGASYTTTTSSVTMTAQWTSAMVLDYDVTDTNSYSSGTTLTNRNSSYPNATLSSSSVHNRGSQSLEFTGGTHGTVGSINASIFSSGLTLDVYASLGNDSSSAWERFIDFSTQKQDGYGNNSYNLLAGRYASTNQVQIEVLNQNSGAGSIGHCRSAENVLDNTIRRYTFVLNGSSCVLYVDGIQKNVTNTFDGTTGSSIPYGLPVSATLNLNYIGKSNWAHFGDAPLSGKIRSIRLLNNASTPSVIDQVDAGRLVYKTVSYSSPESTTAMPAQDVTTGTLALPLASTATRAGYSLSNWFTTSARSTVAAGPGVGYPITASTTLHAGWAANTNTVTYDTQGGSPSIASGTFQTGGSIASAPATSPTKIDHVFAGWSATAGGTAVTFPYSPPETSNITLYAKWTLLTTSQAALTVSSTAGTYGTGLTLTTNGGSGTGAVTYSVTNGTATGCQITAGVLTSSSAGTCNVTASKFSDSTYLSTSSAATPVTLAQRAASVSAGSVTISAGGTITNSYTSSALAGSDSISVVTYTYTGTGSTSYGPSTTPPTAAGTYTITPSVTGMSTGTIASYDFSYTAGNLTINAVGLGTPTSVTAAVNTGVAKSLLITWGAVANATDYTIKVSSGGSELFTVNVTGTSHTLTDSRLANATSYDISVRANGSGNYTTSGFSSNASATTSAAFTITYEYNGADGGNSAVNASFISGGNAITLPTPTRTNYTFDGWFSDIGLTSAVTGPQSPSSSFSVYAKWTQAAYAITFNRNYTNGGSTQANVVMGNSTTLPTPTRANFVFDGWYSAATGGNKIGDAGDSYTPSAATTLYARWIQSSLYGIATGNLSRVGTLTANDLVSSTYNGTLGGNAVEVTLPNASLPAGTIVYLDLITDNSYAQSLISGSNTYILSLAVSWLAPDETVPNANAGKYVQVKITNPSIKIGDLVYTVQGGVATLLATASANGSITIQLTSDPSVYLVSVPVTTTSGNGGTTSPPAPINPPSVEPEEPVTPQPPVTPEEPVVPEAPKLVVVKVPVSQTVAAVTAGSVPVLAGSKLISPILFNPFSAKLDAGDLNQLKIVAQKLRGKVGTLYVTGFVKYVGASKAVMQKIATDRARAVAKALGASGLKIKIGYTGYGPHNLLAPKPTDRRVELRWVASR